LTLDELKKFNELTLGLLDLKVIGRVSRVMLHGEKKYECRPLQSVREQLAHALGHWLDRDKVDEESGLPNKDHAITRLLLALTKILTDEAS
jgi:hypothetical protein